MTFCPFARITNDVALPNKNQATMFLYNKLKQDIRFVEGLKSCMNCGVCTAICPAAEFFDYDPRMLLNEIQSRNDDRIEKLLRSETIWYCGQCMSCKTRCPRGNCPGLVINALRKLSQEMGFFTESYRGRQQYALQKILIPNVLQHGYCIHPDSLKPELHPEQGPIWEWFFQNRTELYDRLGANLDKEDSGTLRKIPQSALVELKAIFDETGATHFLENIENYSQEQAKKMGMKDENMTRYAIHISTTNETTR